MPTVLWHLGLLTGKSWVYCQWQTHWSHSIGNKQTDKQTDKQTLICPEQYTGTTVCLQADLCYCYQGELVNVLCVIAMQTLSLKIFHPVLPWTLLMQGVVSEDGAYVLGIPGFLTEEEMHETLKVNSTLNDIIALWCCCFSSCISFTFIRMFIFTQWSWCYNKWLLCCSENTPRHLEIVTFCIHSLTVTMAVTHNCHFQSGLTLISITIFVLK